jgi:hypothetical protein
MSVEPDLEFLAGCDSIAMALKSPGKCTNRLLQGYTTGEYEITSDIVKRREYYTVCVVPST